MRLTLTGYRIGALAFALAAGAQLASAQTTSTDPRVGLAGGGNDAKEAILNLKLVSHTPKPEGFFDPAAPGSFGFANSDIAAKGNYVFQGNFNGFQIWDISNTSGPKLVTTVVCPGGQGDPSVYNNLLFISVEETRGRTDCGSQGVQDTVSTDRFRGVRIFDITDIAHPKPVGMVQTCRGSHTHTLVTDPNDKKNVYVYVSGTSSARSPNELAGCSAKGADVDPNTSLFRIDVIKVPLASPKDAKIVSSPRIFADSAGNIAGLWKGGAHGDGTQTTSQTNQCHDITVYTAIGLAAGACSGNGILLDIHNPAKPRRVTEVSDPNFAYWHSATFSNDGKKVLFTDEWGGGTQARCRATDKPEWGADAIFTLDKGKLTPAGYFKLPAPQTEQENCVAHNGSLIPVPGRDIMVQAWYQGGVSVFDFSDASHPVEIAYFDRGPMDPAKLLLSGFWSAYWYNGNIIGSEIGRGLDIFTLAPSDKLSQNEIDAANSVRLDKLNAQNQQKIVWPASFAVARSYLDQLNRNTGLASDKTARIATDLDAAEKLSGAKRNAALTKLAAAIDGDARNASDAARVKWLAGAVRDLSKIAH
ncbi:MAG: hypothetical protein ABJE10_20125 [bacterium]